MVESRSSGARTKHKGMVQVYIKEEIFDLVAELNQGNQFIPKEDYEKSIENLRNSLASDMVRRVEEFRNMVYLKLGHRHFKNDNSLCEACQVKDLINKMLLGGK